MSTWIEILSVENATGSLKEAYDLAKTPAGTVDNVMRIHSQRPHTMVGHLTLYRSVLHHHDNTLPLWFLEAIGVFTSLLNNCEYSFKHHCTNMRRLLEDDELHLPKVCPPSTSRHAVVSQQVLPSLWREASDCALPPLDVGPFHAHAAAQHELVVPANAA